MKVKTRGRPRSRYCECGEYVSVLGVRYSNKEPVCDRCYELDGKTPVEMDLLAELQHGGCTMAHLVDVTGYRRETIYDALCRLSARVTYTDGVYRLGRQWDQTGFSWWPNVSAVRFHWLEDRPVNRLHAAFETADGWVVSGPVGEAKFPGRRFNSRAAARQFYESKYDITSELRIEAPRYIFRVKGKDDNSKQDY